MAAAVEAALGAGSKEGARGHLEEFFGPEIRRALPQGERLLALVSDLSDNLTT